MPTGVRPKPLTWDEIFECATLGKPLPLARVLATYADPVNWIQIYSGKSPSNRQRLNACEWAFIGPTRPPYELAQMALGKARARD